MELLGHLSLFDLPTGLLLFLSGFVAGIVAMWSFRERASKKVIK